MQTKQKTIQSVAQEMLDNLETKERKDGTKYICCKERIQWQTDIIIKAHEDRLPNDDIYSFIDDALCVLADSAEGNEQDAIMEIEPDVYTSNLTKWFNNHNGNVYYLTEALEEYGCKDGFQALSMAQAIHKQEVASAVLSGIEQYLNGEMDLN